MVKCTLFLALAFLLAGVNTTALEQDEKQPPPVPPPARKIPGITTEDPFPNGCVDCHINYVDMNLDTRFSTLMKQWYAAVEPKVLAAAQASAPSGVSIKGKHPHVSEALKDIPAACSKCHAEVSTPAPRFANMMHLIHLSGAEENNFLTIFQGECTYCHKLDSSTGRWSIPSGPER